MSAKRIPENFLQDKHDRACKRPKVPPPPELLQRRREVSWLCLLQEFIGFPKKMASILFMPAVGVCGGHFKLYLSKHVRKDSWCTSATTAMMSTLRASMWIFRTCFANYCQIVSMFFATKQVYIDGF